MKRQASRQHKDDTNPNTHNNTLFVTIIRTSLARHTSDENFVNQKREKPSQSDEMVLWDLQPKSN